MLRRCAVAQPLDAMSAPRYNSDICQEEILLGERSKNMIRAKYIMCNKSSVLKDATGRDIVFKLMATGCPGLPVVNEGSEVIGMETMCDMLAASKEKGEGVSEMTAEQVMSKVSITADPDTPVDELSKLMVENNYSVIPIVKGKKLLGVVSGREIVDTFVEPHLYSVFNE